MDSGRAPSRPLALLEVAVAALFALGGAALAVGMPGLVIEGGIRQAHEFINLSPVFFPRLAFGVLAVLGLAYLGRAAREWRRTLSWEGEPWASKYRNVLMILSFIVIYALLLRWLGFGGATFLAVGGVTIGLGSRRWWQILPLAVFAPVVIRFVFERLLLISLPRAEFEFLAVPEEALMKLLLRAFFLA